MMIRIAKLLLLLGVCCFYVLVVFNNLTDFNSNAQFVRHVLLMDTTIPGNHGMWRSISSPALDFLFYASIIVWESITTVLLLGRHAVAARAANARRGVQCREIHFCASPHPLTAHVACGVSYRWRRVVLDVAVAHVEWSGGGLQKLWGRWHRVFDPFAARLGHATMI